MIINAPSSCPAKFNSSLAKQDFRDSFGFSRVESYALGNAKVSIAKHGDLERTSDLSGPAALPAPRGIHSEITTGNKKLPHFWDVFKRSSSALWLKNVFWHILVFIFKIY